MPPGSVDANGDMRGPRPGLGRVVKQHGTGSDVTSVVSSDEVSTTATLRPPGPLSATRNLDDPAVRTADAADRVTELYQATALSLTRLAYVILGDRSTAEDVVQEAFCNLFHRWNRLPHTDSLEYYVRASVVNACRSALRRRAVRGRRVLYELPAPSAEAAVLGGAERDDLIRAIHLLPARQRETLVLRYYLDLPDDEIARLMGVSPSTVRSAAHRALNTLSRTLKEL
jgi:RNA polymerase sigma-70 factor (sigma-E family)